MAHEGATLDRSSENAGPVRIVLENGLTLLVQERAGSRLAATLLLYRAGSLVEPPGKTGLAHLTEHMMFRGTASHPQGRNLSGEGLIAQWIAL